MKPSGKEAGVAQQWLSKTLGWLTLWKPFASRQKEKEKPLLTFGKICQETNIYVLGAFGWVVFFVEGEFFLEAKGTRQNTNCYWNSAELWETGLFIVQWTGLIKSISIWSNCFPHHWKHVAGSSIHLSDVQESHQSASGFWIKLQKQVNNHLTIHLVVNLYITIKSWIPKYLSRNYLKFYQCHTLCLTLINRQFWNHLWIWFKTTVTIQCREKLPRDYSWGNSQ